VFRCPATSSRMSLSSRCDQQDAGLADGAWEFGCIGTATDPAPIETYRGGRLSLLQQSGFLHSRRRILSLKSNQDSLTWLALQRAPCSLRIKTKTRFPSRAGVGPWAIKRHRLRFLPRQQPTMLDHASFFRWRASSPQNRKKTSAFRADGNLEQHTFPGRHRTLATNRLNSRPPLPLSYRDLWLWRKPTRSGTAAGEGGGSSPQLLSGSVTPCFARAPDGPGPFRRRRRSRRVGGGGGVSSADG